MNIPENLLYTDQHEWMIHEGGIAIIGITDYAQSELGDIVFVELPKVGAHVNQGQPFGIVEAVKTVADLFAPVSGEVIEINESLEDDPSQINEDPYGSGWMIKVHIEDHDELSVLMSAEDYRNIIGHQD